MTVLETARQAGVPVIVVHDHPTHPADGIQFLCDLGYIRTSLHAQYSKSALVAVGDLNVAIRTGCYGLRDSKADLTIGVVNANTDSASLMARSDFFDDLLIDVRSSSPNHRTIDTTPVVEPGRASPPIDGDLLTGFAILDLDDARLTNMTFAELQGLKTARVVLETHEQAPEQLVTQIIRAIEPYVGPTQILRAELRGPISRSDWHALNPSNLIAWAANQGTLLQLNIVGLDVDPSEAHQDGRPSFLVSSRRVADQLATTATNDADRVAIAEARDLFTDVLGRHEPIESVQ